MPTRRQGDQHAGRLEQLQEIVGCIPAEMLGMAEADPVARTSESPKDAARRFKAAYIGVLTMMLVVVVIVGLVMLITTDQMPGTLVLLAFGMARTVASLLPAWPPDGPNSSASRCSEEL